MHPKRTLPIILTACLAVVALAWPAPAAAAQHRQAVHSARARPVVVVRAPYYRPYYRSYYRVYYGYPYFGFYPWYGYPFGGYPPYWYGGYYGGDYGQGEAVGSVRVQVKPKNTEVYVDGYYVGIADDFDGLFQRLRLVAGEHEILLYLDGHRAVHQKLYLTPGGTFDITDTMQPLAPGEAPEPRPKPATPPPSNAQAPRPGPEPAPPFGAESAPPPEQAPEPMPRPGAAQVQVAAGYGMLSLQVQPPDAEILIDGQPWHGPENQERLAVQVAAGMHRVEVRKEGYDTFSTEVVVRDGETTPLNVSILRRQ